MKKIVISKNAQVSNLIGVINFSKSSDLNSQEGLANGDIIPAGGELFLADNSQVTLFYVDGSQETIFYDDEDQPAQIKSSNNAFEEDL